MNKKLWVVYLTCGGGHKKAAEAIYHKLKSDFDVQLINLLDFSSKGAKKAYEKGYEFFITHLPFVWKVCFFVFKIKWLTGFYNLTSLFWYKFLFSRFISNLRDNNPGIIISTHFISSLLVSKLKSDSEKFKFITCITDFEVYPLWVNKNTDYYMVANNFTRDYLINQFGVALEMIWVTGIPLREGFMKDLSADICQKYLKPKGLFTMLVFTSYFAKGPIQEIVDKFHKKCGLFVVYGKDYDLKAFIDSKQKEALFLKGFESVEEMWEIMYLSDLIVTKPGGLTVSECLWLKKPMLFIYAIYGQETGNANFVLNQGLGVFPKKDKVIDQISQIIDKKNILADFELKFSDYHKNNPLEDFKNKILDIIK